MYQATSFLYLDRTRPRTLLVSPTDGRVFSERTLTKLRADDKGREYALRQLRDLGAPPIAPGEASDAYVRRVLDSQALRPMHHPGNHVYLTPLGNRPTRVLLRRRLNRGLPYSKRAEGAWNLH